jgi:hypothetical protein
MKAPVRPSKPTLHQPFNPSPSSPCYHVSAAHDQNRSPDAYYCADGFGCHPPGLSFLEKRKHRQRRHPDHIHAAHCKHDQHQCPAASEAPDALFDMPSRNTPPTRCLPSCEQRVVNGLRHFVRHACFKGRKTDKARRRIRISPAAIRPLTGAAAPKCRRSARWPIARLVKPIAASAQTNEIARGQYRADGSPVRRALPPCRRSRHRSGSSAPPWGASWPRPSPAT